ncbi:MAG: response regulator [Candidatus Acidiferrales bacterium]
MKPVRILFVDDSVVIRKLLSDTLSKEASFEVVGTAGDGRIALAKMSQLHPDLITLDIEMPVMNGLEMLAEIRKTDPKTPAIMFSTLTERGAAATGVNSPDMLHGTGVPGEKVGVGPGGLLEALAGMRDGLPEIQREIGGFGWRDDVHGGSAARHRFPG